MCLRLSNVVMTAAPNWEGDEIEHNPIVQAARYVPGTSTRFPIDIREYLSTESNAVVRQAVDAAVEGLSSDRDRALFWSRKPGSFDHRVRTICQYLAGNVRYQRRANRSLKEWLFPDEVLAAGGGDCEDHAFLLAAMVLASGVSGYVVRVALGRLKNVQAGDSTDHAWVMYKNESGHWLILDPLIYTQDVKGFTGNGLAKVAARADGGQAPGGANAKDPHEYIPHFVFNDSHLWAVRDRGQSGSLEVYIDQRKFWQEFDPSFAASVHSGILDRALSGMSWANLQYVKAVSLAVDANIATYDPRDHFDNGYISDAWEGVDRRLLSGNLDDFGLACHAIGDFYAHSSWGVFGQRTAGVLEPLLDHSHPVFDAQPDYGAGGHFPLPDESRFTINDSVWTQSRAAAATHWGGQIISGRYAQNGDPHQGAAERLTYIPKALRERPDYPPRAGLPHHNEIAVDDDTRDSAHRLYMDDSSYLKAFHERVEAAIAHIKYVYTSWSTR